MADARNKGLALCADLIAYLLYYADIRSRQNICFTPNNSDLTEKIKCELVTTLNVNSSTMTAQGPIYDMGLFYYISVQISSKVVLNYSAYVETDLTQYIPDAVDIKLSSSDLNNTNVGTKYMMAQIISKRLRMNNANYNVQSGVNYVIQATGIIPKNLQ